MFFILFSWLLNCFSLWSLLCFYYLLYSNLATFEGSRLVSSTEIMNKLSGLLNHSKRKLANFYADFYRNLRLKTRWFTSLIDANTFFWKSHVSHFSRDANDVLNNSFRRQNVKREQALFFGQKLRYFPKQRPSVRSLSCSPYNYRFDTLKKWKIAAAFSVEDTLENMVI